MSEVKRVELTTVPTSQKEKKVKQKPRTYRLVLTLGDSNATTCPEYSFADLIKNERPTNGDDPFNDPDEDREVAAIAQRFEAKYGPRGTQSGKKKRTQAMDDYYDMGDGYDEDDPFIDNTEAYDEVIPSTMTTQHGGFYINQGKLDFKSLEDDSFDDSLNQPSIKKKKKRQVLDSESEEEKPEALAKIYKAMKRKKLQESREGEKKKKKKLANAEEGEIVIKKKKKKNLDKLKLKKMTASSASPSQKDLAIAFTPTTTMTTPSTPATVAAVTKTTISSVNGTADMKVETPSKEYDPIEMSINANLQEVLKEDSSSKSGEEGKGELQSGDKNTQLPSQLPAELLEAIENIKREAKETKEGKCKFFSADINKLLLDIELGSRNLAWGSRTAIYSHLGEHLPCGKHALQRRAKKLRESHSDDQLKVPIQKLREAIMAVMPALEEQHEIDVQKVKQEAEVKEETADAVKEEASTESEGEEKSDTKKKPRGPRRKFQWNAEMKELLLHIVATKMKTYNTCKSRNQTAEEYLKAYLDSDIRPLWPQGWMQTRMLFKESRAAHEEMTKPQQTKQKKLPSAPEANLSNLEGNRSHVSKTEDVIEVSSLMESDEDKKETVVVNLSNSDMRSVTDLVSVTSQQASQTSLSNTSLSLAGRNSKQQFKPATTAAVSVSLLTSPVNTVLPQKPNDTSTNSSMKRITPTQIIEIPESPPGSSVYRTNATTKAFTPNSTPMATSTPVGHGPSLSPSPSASSADSKSRSFLEAFDVFLQQGLPKLNPSSSSQQQPKPGSMQQLSSQQQKTLSQQPRGVSILQQKSASQQQMANLQQQKLPQEQHKFTTSQPQKAAGRASLSVVVSKDIPNNSSWSNIGSVDPSGKSISPVVAVNRIAVTSSHKQSVGVKGSQSYLHQNPMLPQQQQRTKMHNNADLKQHQNLPHKKRQQSSSSEPFGTIPQAVSISGASFSPSLSSRQDPQGKAQLYSPQTLSQKSSSHSLNPQLKLGTVVSAPSSVQKLGHLQNQQQKTAILLGTSGGSPPQLTVRNAADFTGWTPSGSPGNMKQPSPPGNRTVSVTVGRSSPSTPMASKSSGLLSSSSALSTSRGSTPSPQKSPASPMANPGMSVYEQIQQQIRKQEAMEGQALQNLALALKMGSAADIASFRGIKPATVGHTGKTTNVTSTFSGAGSGVTSSIPQGDSDPYLSSSQTLKKSNPNEGWSSDLKPKAETQRDALPRSDLKSLSSKRQGLDCGSVIKKVGQSTQSVSHDGLQNSDALTWASDNRILAQNQSICEKGNRLLTAKSLAGGHQINTGVRAVHEKKLETDNPRLPPVLEKQTMPPPKFTSNGKEISPPPMPRLQKNSGDKFSLSPNLKNFKVPVTLLAASSKTDTTLKTPLPAGARENVLSSTGSHPANNKNIFTSIERSLPAQFPSCCEAGSSRGISCTKSVVSQPAEFISSSSAGNLLTRSKPSEQVSKESGSLPLEKVGSQRVISSGGSSPTHKPVSTASISALSFQDSFSQYASHLLQGLVPGLQNIQKIPRQLPRYSDLSQRETDLNESQRNRLDILNSLNKQGQGGDASSQSDARSQLS